MQEVYGNKFLYGFITFFLLSNLVIRAVQEYLHMEKMLVVEQWRGIQLKICTMLWFHSFTFCILHASGLLLRDCFAIKVSDALVNQIF